MINDHNVLHNVEYAATEIVNNAVGHVFMADGSEWFNQVIQQIRDQDESQCTIQFSGDLSNPTEQGSRFGCLVSVSFAKHSDGQWHWYFARVVLGNPSDDLKVDCPQERLDIRINRRTDFCTEKAYKHAGEGEFDGYLPDRSVHFEAA